MFCRNCGAQNKDGAKFCGSCGAPLNTFEKTEQVQVNVAHEEIVPVKKKGSKLIIIVSAIVLLVAVVIGVFLISVKKKEQEFNSLVADGARYLEEMDYEKAEDAYLEAIAIDPKKEEPYIQLATIYIEQGEKEKAIDILEQGKENVEDKDNEIIKMIELVEEYIEYEWVLEPTIEADDINYIAEYASSTSSENERYDQFNHSCALIIQGDTVGLIDMNGNLKNEAECERIISYGGNYIMNYATPVYNSEMGMEWIDFELIDGEVVPHYGSGAHGAYGYYYFNELRAVGEFESYYEQEYIDWLSSPIPVRQSQEDAYDNIMDIYMWIDWWNTLEGPYAVYYDGELKTDFIYDECGSYSEVGMAVCQDGKWGYINENGEIIIPIEYDSSWNWGGFVWDVDSEEYVFETRNYCYAFSEGYVPLVKDGQWEMRNAEGNVVIPAGIFEAIRPVYEGKCWVKKDGKWGVIAIDFVEYEIAEETASDMQPESDDQEESENSQISVSERVEEIRSIYYDIQDNLSSMEKEDGGSGTVRYLENGKIRKIVAKPEAYTDSGFETKYTAEYYYQDDLCVFVFVYYQDEEYRFYIKKEDYLNCVRYIDENGKIYDYPEGEMAEEISDLGYYCVLAMQELHWAGVY